MSESLEDYLSSLAGGPAETAGVFTLDVARANQLLAQFGSPRQEELWFWLTAAALEGGARTYQVSFGRLSSRLEDDGAALELDTLDQLWVHLLSPANLRLHWLALGLRAAAAAGLAFTYQSRTLQIRFRRDWSLLKTTGAASSNVFRLDPHLLRSRPVGLTARYLARLSACPVRGEVNGKPIPEWGREGALEPRVEGVWGTGVACPANVRRHQAALSAHVALSRKPVGLSTIELLRSGVQVDAVRLDCGTPAVIAAVAAPPSLCFDLSGRAVRDAALDQLASQLADCARTLLGEPLPRLYRLELASDLGPTSKLWDEPLLADGSSLRERVGQADWQPAPEDARAVSRWRYAHLRVWVPDSRDEGGLPPFAVLPAAVWPPVDAVVGEVEMSVSDDARFLLLSHRVGVWLHDLDQDRRILRLPPTSRALLSPTGQMLAYAVDGRGLALLRRNGSVLHWREEPAEILALAFHPTEETLAVLTPGELSVLHLEDGRRTSVRLSAGSWGLQFVRGGGKLLVAQVGKVTMLEWPSLKTSKEWAGAFLGAKGRYLGLKRGADAAFFDLETGRLVSPRKPPGICRFDGDRFLCKDDEVYELPEGRPVWQLPGPLQHLGAGIAMVSNQDFEQHLVQLSGRRVLTAVPTMIDYSGFCAAGGVCLLRSGGEARVYRLRDDRWVRLGQPLRGVVGWPLPDGGFAIGPVWDLFAETGMGMQIWDRQGVHWSVQAGGDEARLVLGRTAVFGSSPDSSWVRELDGRERWTQNRALCLVCDTVALAAEGEYVSLETGEPLSVPLEARPLSDRLILTRESVPAESGTWRVHIRELKTGQRVCSFPCRSWPSVTISPTGRVVLCQDEEWIQGFHVPDGREFRVPAKKGNFDLQIRCDDSERWVCVCASAPDVVESLLVEAATGEVGPLLPGWQVSLLPGNWLLAARGGARHVYRFEAAQGEPEYVCPLPEGHFRSVAAVGSLLLASESDRSSLFDRNGQEKARLYWTSDLVVTAPDGRWDGPPGAVMDGPPTPGLLQEILRQS